MGVSLFGTHYNSLTPTRDPIPGPALEVLIATKSRSVRTASKPQEHIAERIAAILTDGDTITDPVYQGAAPCTAIRYCTAGLPAHDSRPLCRGAARPRCPSPH